jgi:capsular polysaccharide transport system ATP-binding protein
VIGFHRFRQALAESGKVFDIVADTQRQIDRAMSLSWLLGLQGGFQGSLTDNDKMRFIARISNKPFDCDRRDYRGGDQRFQRRSHEELFEKRADRSLILASHIGKIVKAYCSRALVLHRRRGRFSTI